MTIPFVSSEAVAISVSCKATVFPRFEFSGRGRKMPPGRSYSEQGCTSHPWLDITLLHDVPYLPAFRYPPVPACDEGIHRPREVTVLTVTGSSPAERKRSCCEPDR